MPDIYLKHPKHGYKVCHSESEAAYDRAHGWEDHVRIPANVEVPQAPAVPAFLAAPVVDPVAALTVKPSKSKAPKG